MDKIDVLCQCIVALGAISPRIDQVDSVTKPIISVINALNAVVHEMRQEEEQKDGNQGTGKADTD